MVRVFVAFVMLSSDVLCRIAEFGVFGEFFGGVFRFSVEYLWDPSWVHRANHGSRFEGTELILPLRFGGVLKALGR